VSVLGVFRKTAKTVGLWMAIVVTAVIIVAPTIIVPNCWNFAGCARAYELIMKTRMDDGARG